MKICLSAILLIFLTLYIKPDVYAGVNFFNSADTIKPILERNRWKDSVIIPKRSAMYSMLFPGLGQINNKQYWKLPVVYGLLGVGIYAFQYNLKGYNEFRKIYADRLNNKFGDRYQTIYPSLDEVRGMRDFHKKYLDMTVLLSVLGYGLQIMDANVFAHLKDFDISDNIAFRAKPYIQSSPLGIHPGLGIVLHFK